MKIVFAGPTLHGISPNAFPSIAFRQPAKCGDIIRAVKDGAAIIGLIDGVFELAPAVWHKEILYALSEGIAVLGAASMGALRAAECHSFGMIGVGEVFRAYSTEKEEDDEDVAQLHGPRELGYLPLSEPLVNIRATLKTLLTTGKLTVQEHAALTDAAQALFFKQRTYKKIVESAGLPKAQQSELLRVLKDNSVNIKQQDAVLLLTMVENGDIAHDPSTSQRGWQLARTRSLRHMLQDQ